MMCVNFFRYLPAYMFRLRLGSTYASRGGIVHNVAQHVLHPNYNMWTLDTDVMIMRSSTFFVYTNVLQQGTIASATYNLPDNQEVWVTGWGTLEVISRLSIFNNTLFLC